VNDIGILLHLGLAFVLSSAIGVERELRQKSAGLRTHTLVGVGAAVFMLVSKFGFDDVTAPGRDVLDPSRMAAQIVSGVGFLGAGIIFVRRDAVRGLTTAAGIWLTAAVGAAAGASLWLLAIFATIVYYVVAFGFPPLVNLVPALRHGAAALRIAYEDGRGILRPILAECTRRGFVVADVHINSAAGGPGGIAEVTFEVRGQASVPDLVARLGELDGVIQIRTGQPEDLLEE
jgi:putative Mg2+ transporter-C (MgtC) family protein